jgi:gliding motility-associated-like protein
VITDPNLPHLLNAKVDCDGTKIRLLLNKKMRCNSHSPNGSEYSILPAVTTVVSAVTDSCNFGFDFDEVTITLAAPLTNGNYQLVINNGADGNTLRDHCDNLIPQGESVPFVYAIPQPIFADSIGKPGCAPDSVVVYFPKRIICNTIAANGSDFSVSGPAPVTVIGAYGNCVDNKTERIVVKFASPIGVGGTYQLTLKAGDDGTVVVDECGLPTPVHSLPFVTADTVNAEFTYTGAYGCQRDTLTFLHDGAHQVNSWNWTFNDLPPVTTQQHTISFPATSTNNIKLVVSNGTCSDTSETVLVLDNEVKANFTTESIICPEDPLAVINTSTGQVDTWLWQYDVVGTSNLKDPPPFLFPTINREAYYTVRLICSNNTLGCSDTLRKTLTVLDHCFIDIPTAFTPNNDGLNDNFGPHNALKTTNYHFRIFNRWGQPVFESRNWRDRWDGKIKGVIQTTGVFVWMLSYTTPAGQQVSRKGTVAVIR